MAIGLVLLMVIPLTVRVDADVPPKVVARAMDEAAAIWRDVGVELEWDTADPIPESVLEVEFGDARGVLRESEPRTPVAWIGFANNAPNDAIYVSRANALALLVAADHHGGQMTIAERNEYLGRALGRALAHEIGHYLFRSSMHDQRGVMATNRSTDELFGSDRAPFLLTAAERSRLALRLEGDRVAQRPPSPLG